MSPIMREKSCLDGCRKNTYLTPLPLVSVRRNSHYENTMNVEMKFHLDCKFRFPCSQFMMHWTNLSMSTEARYRVSWLSLDVERTRRRAIRKTALEFVEVTARQESGVDSSWGECRPTSLMKWLNKYRSVRMPQGGWHSASRRPTVGGRSVPRLTTRRRERAVGVAVLVAVVHPWVLRKPTAQVTSHRQFHIRRQFPFPFGAAVLEPDFYLRLTKLKRLGQLHAARNRQVLALSKFALQIFHLIGCEGCAFAFFRGIPFSALTTARRCFLLLTWNRAREIVDVRQNTAAHWSVMEISNQNSI